MLYEGVTSLASGVSLGIGNTSCQRVIDFGSGLGKAAVQLFFQHSHLLHVLGVELMPSRYNIAADALQRLYLHLTSAESKTDPKRFRMISEPKRVGIEEVMETGGRHQVRLLELRRQNMFELRQPCKRQPADLAISAPTVRGGFCMQLARFSQRVNGCISVTKNSR